MTRHELAMAVVVAATLVLGACTATGGTKAGGGEAAITLRIGTDDGAGRPASDQIEEFAHQVASISRGRLRIAPVWNAAGDTGGDDWDQKVARLVISGELDMAMVPSRAWDTEGVTTLRALNAPFLITSAALTAQVVTSDLVEPMLAGLDAVGVHGLALLPEGLRRVFGFGEPLLRIDHFDGALIRTPASATTYATFHALGAVPDDVTANDTAVRSGKVAGAESSFLLARALPVSAVTVGNQPLWPKVNSLVINTAALQKLPEDLRDVLEQAAETTREWAIEHIPDEATAAAAFCADGGTVVPGSAADLAAMATLTEPVVTELERDTTTRELIQGISAMRQSSGAQPDAVPACAGADTARGSGGTTNQPGDAEVAFPLGTFRAHISADILRSAGVSVEDTNRHAGVWTITFGQGGQFQMVDVNDRSAIRSQELGQYCASGDQIRVGIQTYADPGQPPQCGNLLTARWALDGDLIRFSDVQSPAGRRPDSRRLEVAIVSSVPYERVR